MVKKLVMRILEQVFPFKGPGDVDISPEQMERRSIESTERFWGGRAPVVVAWSKNDPERVFSKNLQRKLDRGEEIPHPTRIIG